MLALALDKVLVSYLQDLKCFPEMDNDQAHLPRAPVRCSICLGHLYRLSVSCLIAAAFQTIPRSDSALIRPL